MSGQVTEREMIEFTKAMKEWEEKQKIKRENFENSLLYRIYKYTKKHKGDRENEFK